MTRIGQVDHILLLLREQLRRAEAKRGERASSVTRREGATPPPLDRVKALAAMAALGEEEARRVVVRGLLADRLGDAVSNDPDFVHLVDQVIDAIGNTPEGAELLDRAMVQIRLT